jgi:hypothetical protein
MQQVLCRSELSSDLHLLLAPTGGSLQAIAPPVNEFSGPLASPASGSSSSSSGGGSTGSALAAGHGLYGPAASGTGAGLTWMAGDLSASAGSFLSGGGQRASLCLPAGVMLCCCLHLRCGSGIVRTCTI